jgi:hypothetical protein
VPTIEEVGCRSFHRNVLDPLLGHIEMTMTRSIIVKHVSRTISGAFLSEPAVGTIVYRNWGTATVKPQSSLVPSHGRLPDLREFNNSLVRCLYPSFQSLAFAVHSARHGVAAAVFDLQPQEVMFSGLSIEEFIVRRWWSLKLSADVRWHMLTFLVPGIVHIPRHDTI